MTTTNIYEIKPQQNLRNKVSRILSQNNLRQLENHIKVYVGEVLCGLPWIQQIAKATDEEAEALAVAPVECTRFPSAIQMACVESLKVGFTSLDGMDAGAKLFVRLETEKLQKAFSLYASGAFRRDVVRSKYPQLEALIPSKDAPEEIGVEVELEWSEVDGVPQMTLLLCTATAGDSTKWITTPLMQDMNRLIGEMNSHIMEKAS